MIMATILSSQHCVPCEGATKPLTREEFSVYLEQIPQWQVVEDKHLDREFVFANFDQALEFVNKVGKIAQAENHHPDINLHNWKKVTITLTTHAIGGLSVNDFVLAAKIDAL